MQHIQMPKRGVPITAEWGQKITQAVNSMSLRGGNGIVVSSSQNGMTISLANNGKNPSVESPSEYAFKLSKVSDKWCICLPTECLTFNGKSLDLTRDLTVATVPQDMVGEGENIDSRFGHVYELDDVDFGESGGVLCLYISRSNESDGESSGEIDCEFKVGGSEGEAKQEGSEEGKESSQLARIPIAYVNGEGRIEQITRGAVVLSEGGVIELLVKSKENAEEEDSSSEVDEETAEHISGRVKLEGQGNIEIYGDEKDNKVIINSPRIPVEAGESGVSLNDGQKVFVVVTPPETGDDAKYVVDLTTSKPEGDKGGDGCCNGWSDDNEDKDDELNDPWSSSGVAQGGEISSGWGSEELGGDGNWWSGDHCPKDPKNGGGN